MPVLSKVEVLRAGGSIGSELCRQILRCDPARLIILGHGENGERERVRAGAGESGRGESQRR